MYCIRWFSLIGSMKGIRIPNLVPRLTHSSSMTREKGNIYLILYRLIKI